MAKKIALQLYTIREIVGNDYEGVVRKIAAMGYHGVETAGFPGTTAEAASRLFQELGLEVTSAHVPLPLGENKQKVLETLDALGKPPLICTQITKDDVKTTDTIRALCDRLNEGYMVAHDHGLAFGIHNHWWEFGEVDGRLVHHFMLELLEPDIFFELDTYWIQVAGCKPADYVRALGNRVPMLHIKDGPAVKDVPMTALGDGVIDIPAILEAAIPDVWQIVELDRCATDVLEATKKSFDYLARL